MLVSYFTKRYVENKEIVEDKKLKKIYSEFCQTTKKMYPIFDRSGVLPHFLPVTNICPLPDLNNPKILSYRDVGLLEATRIINLNRKLNIFWSGGIDSTSIICFLMLAGIKPEQLHITLTPTSVAEYPWFYENVILKQKIDHGSLDKPVREQIPLLPPDYLNITGELLGTLFNAGNKAGLDVDPTASYKEWLKPHLVEFFEPWANACPRPVKSFTDFQWLNKFLLQWQFFTIRKNLFSEHVNNNMIHFGNNDLFQYWALFTNEEKGKTKQTAKKIILEYTKDEDFFNNKKQVMSIADDSNMHIMGWWGALTKEPIHPDSSKVFLEEGKLIIR